jgi:hypothetical protein
MIDPRDYSTWTDQDHQAAAERLAAEADDLADGDVPGSRAALHRESIVQTVGRGLLHAHLARLKKPTPAVTVAPTVTAADATAGAAARAAAAKSKPARAAQNTGDA